MNSLSSSLRLASTVAVMAMAAACAPASYNIKEPQPSGLKYEAVVAGTTTLSILDERAGDKMFSSGVLPAALVVDGTPIDPPQFLAKQLQAEMLSRGLTAESVVGGNAAPRIHLKTFNMLNDRVSGFSPFVTLTFLSADVETSTGTRRVGVFVKRGKVPVWSFSEVIEPIFAQPLSIAVKEFSAKVANFVFGYRSSDSEVQKLITKLAGTRGDTAFLDVYMLGFSNNPAAIPTLVTLSKDADEYVRLAAISSLGTIGATAEFSLLRSIHENKESLWQDRAMALKSIADLGTDETKAYAAEEMKRLGAASVGKDSKWTAQLLAMYL
jgi:hypothetical protein